MQNFFQFLFACGQPKKLKGMILRCLSLCSLITIINWLLFYADCNWMLLCRIDWKWSFSPFSKLIWMHERGVIINFELKIWGTTDMFNFILFTSQKTKFFLGLLKKRDFTERDGIVKRTLCQMLLFSSKNSPNFDFRKLGKKWSLKKLRSKKKNDFRKKCEYPSVSRWHSSDSLSYQLVAKSVKPKLALVKKKGSVIFGLGNKTCTSFRDRDK